MRSQAKQEVSKYKLKIRSIEDQLDYKKEVISPEAGFLVLEIDVERDILEKLEVSYFSKNASWWPSYDFRITKIDQPLEMTYMANVSQQTGEDWKDVSLVVSSANPLQTNRPPEMQVWDLSSFQKAPFDKEKNQTPTNGNTINGRVTSAEDGEGMPGVSVLVSGTTIGTSTDINGDYQIEAPDRNVELTYSFIGLKTQNIKVRNRSEINVSLHPNVQKLEEVVVVGYATQSVSADYLKGTANGVEVRKRKEPRYELKTIESHIEVKSKQVDVEFEVK